MPEHASGHRRAIILSGVLLVSLGSVLGGCASTAAPRMTIEEVSVEEESADAMVLLFSVRGENPNPFPLPLEEVTYRLELGGERVFSGIRSAQITIPRSSSGMLKLPVAFEFDDLGGEPSGAEPYRLTGRVQYRPDGTFPGVLFDSGAYRPSASFEVSGVLDFSAMHSVGPVPEGESGSVRILSDPED